MHDLWRKASPKNSHGFSTNSFDEKFRRISEHYMRRFYCWLLVKRGNSTKWSIYTPFCRSEVDYSDGVHFVLVRGGTSYLLCYTKRRMRESDYSFWKLLGYLWHSVQAYRQQ